MEKILVIEHKYIEAKAAVRMNFSETPNINVKIFNLSLEQALNELGTTIEFVNIKVINA